MRAGWTSLRDPDQRASGARGDRLNRDARGERRAKREPCAAYIKQHRVSRVDHADIGSFTQAKGAQTTGFI